MSHTNISIQNQLLIQFILSILIAHFNIFKTLVASLIYLQMNTRPVYLEVNSF